VCFCPAKMTGMLIRNETSADYFKVAEINRLAFGGEQEVELLDCLRSEKLLIASLVAVDSRDQIFGHILFSRAVIHFGVGDVPVASLAAMAVPPEMQLRGIGSALVRHGIKACRRAGETAIIVMGHPEFYNEFGFSRESVQHIKGPFAGEAFWGLELVPGALSGIKGEAIYPAAFTGVCEKGGV